MILPVVVMLLLVSSGSSLMTDVLRADGVGTSEAVCDALCSELKRSTEPAVACKAFLRALPRPKMGRTCAHKFEEGYGLACHMLCER